MIYQMLFHVFGEVWPLPELSGFARLWAGDEWIGS
jgi:hypothetical protein